ncbi:alpha/beta fold hydrolase [Lentibacillus sp. N15]|uniref:alpha/beta hydrolase n=1 Tax=Lentibacillus songyuanensis TaxID=3136161 RepID=UPI0031BABC5E
MKENQKKMEKANQPVTLAGTWGGEVEIPDQPLEITLKFKEMDDSTEGSISIPIQHVADFSLSNIKVEQDQVSFDMPLPGQKVHFSGTVKVDKIEGTFTQNGQSFPFHVKKGSDGVQTEKDDEDFLSIETTTGTLYGSLLTPEEGEQFPVALIIPGSGPTDRNGNSPGIAGKNDSLKLLAEGLAENDIASLRYDKRGAGKNTQAVTDEKDMRFDQFVTDAKQWITELQEDSRFSDIIVIGHSQGSLVGMLAAEESDVNAFISIAGAGHSLDDVLGEQLKTLPDDLQAESQQILQQLKQGKTVTNVDSRLQSLFRPSVQPFLISWMKFDPAREIARLDMPTLIINGKNDLQVAVQDAEELAAANLDAKMMLIETMNHVLKEAPTDREGNIATYSDLTLPLAEGLLNAITTFLSGAHISSK